jgi:hypothetical protein
MTILLLGIPLSQDAPVDSVKRAAVAGAVEILQRKVQMKSGRTGFEACSNGMCELRIKNQQLRWALHGNDGAWRDGNERRNV